MRVNQTKWHKNFALINYKAINAQEKCVKHDFEGLKTVFKKVPILSGCHFIISIILVSLKVIKV